MTLERALKQSVAVKGKKEISKNQPHDHPVPAHLQTGQIGEDTAADYLIKHGYKVLGRNVRYNRIGEIDIIARDGDYIVFTEVRTRSVGRIMPPEATVGPDKMKKLIRAARIWVENNNYYGLWRIDLIAITIDTKINSPVTVEHIKDITEGIL